MLTKTNYLVGVALLRHDYMGLGGVIRGFLGLVDTGKPKLFHFVFDAFWNCHPTQVFELNLAPGSAPARGKPSVIAAAVSCSIG